VYAAAKGRPPAADDPFLLAEYMTNRVKIILSAAISMAVASSVSALFALRAMRPEPMPAWEFGLWMWGGPLVIMLLTYITFRVCLRMFLGK
jgi:hypothetical protein